MKGTDFASIASNLDSNADTTEIVDAVTEMATAMDELEGRVDELEGRVDDLEDGLGNEQDTRGQEDAQVRSRVHDLEGRVDSIEKHGSGHSSPGESMKENDLQDDNTEPQTDIERMVEMPDSLLEDRTANVRRAIFVASDVEDYTTGCPAGRVIKSGELRRVLQAGTDCNGHTQTVARVMDLLDRTGSDSTTVVERRGERRLVFEQDLVDRLSAQTQRCDNQPVEAT